MEQNLEIKKKEEKSLLQQQQLEQNNLLLPEQKGGINQNGNDTQKLQIDINEFEEILDADGEAFELNQGKTDFLQGEGDLVFDEKEIMQEEQKELGDLDEEEFESNQGKTDFLKSEGDLVFDEKEIFREEQKELGDLDGEEFELNQGKTDFLENEEELVFDEKEIVQEKQKEFGDLDEEKEIALTVKAPMQGLRNAIGERFGRELNGRRKNEALLELCLQMNRLVNIDEELYSGAGFTEGGIAFDLLKQYGSKKFLHFLEEKRIDTLKKLNKLYYLTLGTPVPDRYLPKKRDNPRDPELMKQFAAYRVKKSSLFRDLQGMNWIANALQIAMPLDYADRLGINSVGEQLEKEHEKIVKDTAEEDRILVVEGENLVSEVKEMSFSLLNQDALEEDRAEGTFEFEKWLTNTFEEKETEDDDDDDEFEVVLHEKDESREESLVDRLWSELGLPQVMLPSKGMNVDVKNGETYPPLMEGEGFFASANREAEYTSRMARLLNMGSLVREAVKGVKNQNGVAQNGVIVKTHEGDRLPEALEKGKTLTAPAKKQIAEIVMLNLICGNLENKEGQLIVEKTDPDGNIIALREATGTELAFRETYGKEILKQYGGGNEMSLLSLGNLSGEAKKKILGLSPELVKEVFAKDLSEKQMAALLSRISAVKELIRSFDNNMLKEKTFAAKKMRKYLNSQKERKLDDKMAELPEELAEGKMWMVYFRGAIDGYANTKLHSMLHSDPPTLSQGDKDQILQAMKEREAALSSVLVNQVDRYLALSKSVDFAAKLRANDPAAVAVKRDYEQRILDASRAYKARMVEENRRLQACRTRADLLAYASECKVIKDRSDYFASIQQSRYKNNEDSDSMLLVKESVRVLSERVLDSPIKGAEGLKRKLEELKQQYTFAIENCKAYITSHKPRIGFWHEDGRKRYEMVQALEKRLVSEQSRIEKTGSRFMKRLETEENASVNLSDLLFGEELEIMKPVLLFKEKERREAAEKEEKPVNKEAMEKERFVTLEKAREAAAKLKELSKVEFFLKLKFSDASEILNHKDENDRVFQEMEEAFSVVRDFLLLGGSLGNSGHLGMSVKEQEELRLAYACMKSLKRALDETVDAVKELTEHPMWFSGEGAELSELRLDELKARENAAYGEQKRYLGLLLTLKKNRATLDTIQRAGGFNNFLIRNRSELKKWDETKAPDVHLLKDLLSDFKSPVQEKERVEKVLKSLYQEKKLKGAAPKYLIAHLYGKDVSEIRTFLDRFASKEANVRKEALKEIVERAAKDPSVILHNTAQNPSEMYVNAEYNYGLALRAAALDEAYKEYKKVSPESEEELDQEAKQKIAVAKNLTLDRYEERLTAFLGRLLTETNIEANSGDYIKVVNKETK